MNRNKSRAEEKEDMGMSYWERVAAGAIGGGLIVAAVSNFSEMKNLFGVAPSSFFALAIVSLGILAIYYGRYG